MFRPFVLRLLRTAVLDPRIAVHMSAVPVGAELGLTAILAADTPPYCAWGAGMAEFGAQAAIEAQSPYYKLLIGRVLGYEMDNIRAHVEVCRHYWEMFGYNCIPCAGWWGDTGACDDGPGGQRARAFVRRGTSAAMVAPARPRGYFEGGRYQAGWVKEERGCCCCWGG